MALTLRMSPDVEQALAAQASDLGLSPEQFAEQIVADRVTSAKPQKRILKGYGSMAHLDKVTVDSYLAHKAEERALEGIE